jgi:hypothetical protein
MTTPVIEIKKIREYRVKLGNDLCFAEHQQLDLEEQLRTKKLEVEQLRGALFTADTILKFEPYKDDSPANNKS